MKAKVRKLTRSLQNQRKAWSPSLYSCNSKVDQTYDQTLNEKVLVSTTSLTQGENWTTKDENSTETIPENANNNCATQEEGNENSQNAIPKSPPPGCDFMDGQQGKSLTDTTPLWGTPGNREPAIGGPPRDGNQILSSKIKFHVSHASGPIEILELHCPEPTQPGAESAKTSLLAETSFTDRKPATSSPPKVGDAIFSSETEFRQSTERDPIEIWLSPPRDPAQPTAESAKPSLLAKTSFTDRNHATGAPPRVGSKSFSSETEFHTSSAKAPITNSGHLLPDTTLPAAESAETGISWEKPSDWRST